MNAPPASVGRFGWWETAGPTAAGWVVREEDAAVIIKVPVRNSLLLWMLRRGPQTLLRFDRVSGRIELPQRGVTLAAGSSRRWAAELMKADGPNGGGLRPRVDLWLVASTGTGTGTGEARYAVASRLDGWSIVEPLTRLITATGLPADVIDEAGVTGWGFKRLSERLRTAAAAPAEATAAQPNCRRNRTSFSVSRRMSLMPCRIMQNRSMPKPKAKPLTRSGS